MTPPRLALLAGLLAFSGVTAAAAQDTLNALAQQINLRVVKIYGGEAGLLAGYGSGVLVSSDGQIVTVLSALLDSSNLRVELASGRQLPARVVARDPQRRLALLQIAAEELPAVTLAAEPPAVGDWIIAAANAFQVAAGYEPVTLTPGIVAGIAPLEGRRRTQTFRYTGEVLLTDVVLSTPGSAGGGVFNLAGELVGIIGPAVQSRRTGTWLNYAFPAASVAAFLEAAEQGDLAPGPTTDEQPPRAGYLGLQLLDFVGLDQPAYIERVHRRGPARAAGLRPNDLIVAIDGEPVETCREAGELIDSLAPGETVTMTVKRGEALQPIPVTVEPPPAQ